MSKSIVVVSKSIVVVSKSIAGVSKSIVHVMKHVNFQISCWRSLREFKIDNIYADKFDKFKRKNISRNIAL